MTINKKPAADAGLKVSQSYHRLLGAYLFYSLQEVRTMAEEWRQDYNHERPHESLGYVPPVEFI